jgi:hypothetical protein
MDLDLMALSLGAIAVLTVAHFLNVIYDRWSRAK